MKSSKNSKITHYDTGNKWDKIKINKKQDQQVLSLDIESPSPDEWALVNGEMHVGSNLKEIIEKNSEQLKTIGISEDWPWQELGAKKSVSYSSIIPDDTVSMKSFGVSTETIKNTITKIAELSLKGYIPMTLTNESKLWIDKWQEADLIYPIPQDIPTHEPEKVDENITVDIQKTKELKLYQYIPLSSDFTDAYYYTFSNPPGSTWFSSRTNVKAEQDKERAEDFIIMKDRVDGKATVEDMVEFADQQFEINKAPIYRKINELTTRVYNQNTQLSERYKQIIQLETQLNEVLAELTTLRAHRTIIQSTQITFGERPRQFAFEE